jgi:antitoxin (DNA-binding transcriptional repressor) of toxin-antitoxin stability system
MSNRVRTVTVRELSRETKRVLDDVAKKRRSALVVYFGQPVALITPISGRVGVDPRLDAPLSDEADRSTAAREDDRIARLTDLQRRVLEAIQGGEKQPDRIAMLLSANPREVAIDMVRLELAGLVVRRWSGWEPI